jgi:type II secretory pathway pseudopilin PulG
MIFYTKLKKLKKSNNRRFSPSFTLIELLIIIVIIGIIISSISFNLAPDKLNLAVDNLMKYINYTQSLVLKDDKYQPFSKNKNNIYENNLSKYWYKKWWRIGISSTNNNEYFFEIFSDMNLNGNDDVSECAKDPLTHKYLKGNYNSSTASTDTNLSKFNIKCIKYKYKNNEVRIDSHNRLNIYFDNFGNVYKKLYNDQIFKTTSTLGSNILTSNLIIKIYSDDKCQKNCKAIIITPSGYTFKSTCN